MSRLDDLIDLIQTANEIYLVNPARNVRSAYIQIDDLCELTIKSWLQENVIGWSPISHTHNNRDYFKGFRTITSEIQSQFSTNQTVNHLLSQIEARRDNRNNFFHNHNQAGLTVDEKNCLLAFCDLYSLTQELFGANFTQKIQANPVVRAQIALIRLRLRSFQTRMAYDQYQLVLNKRGKIELFNNSLGYEFCALYEDATRFLRWIQEHFEEEIMLREDEVNRINSLQRIDKKNRAKLNYLNDEMALFREIISECLI